MFGWRLIRTADLTALQGERAALQARVDALYERLITKSAEAGAKGGEAAFAMARLNAMELEAANVRHKLSGIAAVAPQVSPATPAGATIPVHGVPALADLPLGAQVGGGMDLYSDVGDQRAAELKARGLLHDDGDDLTQPDAASLTAGLGV